MVSQTIVSPPGTAKYPKLLKPDTKFDPEGSYSVEMIFDPSEEGVTEYLDKLEAAYEATYEEQCKNTGKKKLKRHGSPVRAEEDDEGTETGNMLVRFKTKATWPDGSSRRPHIQDARGNPFTADIGGGSQLRVNAELYGWYTPSLGVGLSLQPKHVRVLKLVEWTGGDCDFGGEDDGFTVEPEEAEASTGGDF